MGIKSDICIKSESAKAAWLRKGAGRHQMRDYLVGKGSCRKEKHPKKITGGE